MRSHDLNRLLDEAATRRKSHCGACAVKIAPRPSTEGCPRPTRGYRKTEDHAADATRTFSRNYQAHLKHLTLKGLQPKTVDAYSRAIRRLGEYFDQRIDDLSEAQLLEYFSDLVASHSWSTVKLDLYGLTRCQGQQGSPGAVAAGYASNPASALVAAS